MFQIDFVESKSANNSEISVSSEEEVKKPPPKSARGRGARTVGKTKRLSSSDEDEPPKKTKKVETKPTRGPKREKISSIRKSNSVISI